jgi:hypothetical protein
MTGGPVFHPGMIESEVLVHASISIHERTLPRGVSGRHMDVTWYPCGLQPLSFLGFQDWEVTPGMTAGRILDWEKTLLDQAPAPIKENFEPNFLIRIDHSKFVIERARALKASGFPIDDYLRVHYGKGFNDGHIVQMLEPVRWVLISLLLCRAFDVSTPICSYSFTYEDDATRLRPTASTRLCDGYRTSRFHVAHIEYRLPLDMVELNAVADKLQPYYQAIQFQQDRLSVALHSLWAFFFSQFPEQSYVSLVTILEALLSTGNDEIAHQISERSAVLLRRSPPERLELYREMKKLYGLRSKIAHGDIEPTKGTINWNSTVISARGSLISTDMLTKMARHATAAIRAVLDDAELLSVIQDKAAKERLSAIFLKRLFAESVDTSKGVGPTH